MNGYVIDDLALSAGLTGVGGEQHRRELSRLLHDAIAGGLALHFPAWCLMAAALTRPSIAGHLAEIIAAAPNGSITVPGLVRTASLDQLRAEHESLDWPAMHAATLSVTHGLPILTVDPARYAGVAVVALTL